MKFSLKIFSFLIIFASCKKTEPVLSIVEDLKYVNLKYPQVGQKSLYQYFEKPGEDDYCEPTYFKDTLVLEIFEETSKGFLIRRYLTPHSFSQYDSSGYHFYVRKDTLIRELWVQNDTAFIFEPPTIFSLDILMFGAIPLKTPAEQIEIVEPCKPLLWSFSNLHAGQPMVSGLNSVTVGGHAYSNAIVMSAYAVSFGPIQNRELILSSYHHVIKGYGFSQSPTGERSFGYELIPN